MGRVCLFWLALSSTAAAQPSLDDLVRTDPFSDDPIGVDAQSDLHRVPVAPPADPSLDPAVIASRGPRPPAVEPAAGEVLAAIPGVREEAHRVHVRLADGLAEVETHLAFVNGARHRAEVRYVLRVPEGSELAALEVCVAAKCRRGLPDAGTGALSAYDDALRARPPEGRPSPLPIAHARPVRTAEGPALVLRAAALDSNGGRLEVRVRYVVPAPVGGGVVRLRLPARGRDPRAAGAELRVGADGLLAPSIDGLPASGAAQVDPWVPVELTARLPTGEAPTATAAHFACGDRRCARLRVAAGPRASRPHDLVVLVDASPSMEGPARGRVGAAVAALLASAPPGSQVRGAVFGARAEPVLAEPTPADRVRLAPFARAALRQLGAATRFEAAWELVQPWVGRGTHVVVVGDGAIAEGAEARAAFDAARRAGVVVSVVNVADRATWDALAGGAERTGGVVVEAGAAGERAARGRGTEPLEEAVARIFAPVVAREVWVGAGGRRLRLGALRAGEERVWEGEIGRGRAWIAAGAVRARSRAADDRLAWALAAAAPDDLPLTLAAVDPQDLGSNAPDLRCDPLGPPRVASGVSSDLAPIAPAHARSCEVPSDAPPTERTSVPERTVLNLLRQRVMPVARRCFRRDRAGRADYSVRATFEIRLADREVVAANVVGRIDEDLHQCLLGAVDELDVPRFSGTVVVRYPVYTAPEPRPPTIELEPEVAREVDRVLR